MANRIKLQPTIGAEVPNQDYSVMIGTDATESAKFTDSDIGKAVKMATGAPDSRVVLCADGDEIHAQLQTVEASQTSAGFRVGTARFVGSPMFTAINKGAGALAVGDEVVAAAQAAIGTPNNTPPYHVVMAVKKAGTAKGDGTRLKVVAIQSGTGATDSIVTLSRILF